MKHMEMTGYNPSLGREMLTRSQERALHGMDADALDADLPSEFHAEPVSAHLIRYVGVHPIRGELVWVMVEGKLCPISSESSRYSWFIKPGEEGYSWVEIRLANGNDVGYDAWWHPSSQDDGIPLQWARDGDGEYELTSDDIPTPEITVGIHAL